MGAAGVIVKIDGLIGHDGRSGGIAPLVMELRSTGAQVIHVGYLRSPSVLSGIEHCRNEEGELERRIAQLAASDMAFIS